ncbi:MAG TPA: hypothetical protein VMU75_12425 [Acidimicrobiales bacterium]|nr:hypothetical protein [Acidimicrobiales bacterium]
MTDRLYVTTGPDGVEHTTVGDIVWQLPAATGTGPVSPTVAEAPVLILRSGDALLDVLNDRIFTAEPVDAGGAATAPASAAEAGADGTLAVRAARLLAEANWDPERAAAFALDCVEHAVGENVAVPLPHGRTIGGVIEEARRFLERADAEGGLARLARLAAARRLRRTQETLGDVAFQTSLSDKDSDIDTLDDPAWTTIAALQEAVLAAVEALRHVALPRYVATRESVAEEAGEHEAGEERSPRTAEVITTPWGAIAFGTEHVPAYEPAAVCARDAADRVRQAVADRDGAAAGVAERRWQAERLEAVLSGS